MKKKLAVLTAIMCAFAMTACGSSSGKTDAAQEKAASQIEATQSKVEETQSKVEEAAESLADEVKDTAEKLATMTYDEFVAADIDEPVCVETYVQAKQSWWDNMGTLYTQNQDGAYFIYAMPMSEEEYEKLVPGTKILVNGYKANWSGETEIIDATYEIVEGDTFIAEPTDITELLGSDDLINYQNQFISVQDMKVMPSTDADGNEVAYIYNYDGSGQDGDDLYFNVSKGGEGDPVYKFTVESYLTGPGTDVYEAVQNLQIGQTVDMQGFLYWYEGANPHITSVTVK